MGIKPEGTNPIIVPPDNPTSRWQTWEADLDAAGTTASEVFAETHAIAQSAKSEAQLAVEDSGRFLTAAANMREEALEGVDPASPEYALWAAWDLADQAQDQAVKALGAAVLANDNAIKGLLQAQTHFRHIPTGQNISDDYWTATWSGDTVTITPKEGWVGTGVILSSQYIDTTEGPATLPKQTPISSPGASVTVTSKYVNASPVGVSAPVTIIFTVNPGESRERTITGADQALPDGVWTTLASWSAPSDTSAAVSASLVWTNKTYLGSYDMRVLLNGADVTSTEAARNAPLFGTGQRSHQVTMSLTPVQKHDVVEVQARASTGSAATREVRDISMRVQWIGEDDTAVVETVAITGTLVDESMVQFRQALADRGLHYSTITEVPFNLDTSGATTMRDMFWDCSSLTSVPDMDTSQVTDMGSLFGGCSSLTTVPPMDTSQVTDMGSMFQGCSALTHVPDLNTAQVTNMAAMFLDCAALTDGNVRLIGRHPQVETYNMILRCGLTREPFFDAAGNPI